MLNVAIKKISNVARGPHLEALQAVSGPRAGRCPGLVYTQYDQIFGVAVSLVEMAQSAWHIKCSLLGLLSRSGSWPVVNYTSLLRAAFAFCQLMTLFVGYTVSVDIIALS